MSSTTSSSSSQTSAQSSSSGQAANLQIVAARVSHAVAGTPVAGTCSGTMPPAGASYIEVTNNGTASASINKIVFDYVEMMTESGAPTGACVVAAGATEYITLTGVGVDTANAGEAFTVSVFPSSGSFVYLQGAFG